MFCCRFTRGAILGGILNWLPLLFPTHGGFWHFKEPSHSKFGYEEMLAIFSEKNDNVSTFNCPSVHFISQHVSHVLGSSQ